MLEMTVLGQIICYNSVSIQKTLILEIFNNYFIYFQFINLKTLNFIYLYLIVNK